MTDLSATKSSFICHEVDIWGSLRSLRTSLTGATARLSQQGAEVADLRLLCADLRAEAAATRAEVQRRQSEFDQVADERDQSRGRAAEAESRAGALAVDLAVAQAAASEQRARAGGMSWLFSVFVSACFLRLCLRPCALAVRRARVCP
jgi:chromosome segregation ATPase